MSDSPTRHARCRVPGILLLVAGAGLLASPSRAQEPAAATNLAALPEIGPTNVAIMYWGQAAFTVGDGFHAPGPAWWLDSFKIGGSWTDAGWYVGADEPADAASLNIVLDRTILTNDVRLHVKASSEAGSSLFVDLFNAGNMVVLTNVCGNLLGGVATQAWVECTAPLAADPAAVGIRLRRGAGSLLVEATLVAPGDLLADTEPAPLDSMAAMTEAPGLGNPIPGRTPPALPVAGLLGGTPDMAATLAAAEADETTVYVDAQTGDDANTGMAKAFQRDRIGPVKSIRAGLAKARIGGSVIVAEGEYHENVDISAMDVQFLVVGNVVLK